MSYLLLLAITYFRNYFCRTSRSSTGLNATLRMSTRRIVYERRYGKSRIDKFSERATAYRGFESTSYAYQRNTTKTPSSLISELEKELEFDQTIEIERNTRSDVETILMSDTQVSEEDPDDFDRQEQDDESNDDMYSTEDENDFDNQEPSYENSDNMNSTEDESDFEPREHSCDGIDAMNRTDDGDEIDGSNSPFETEYIPSFRKGSKRNYHGHYGPYFPNYTAAAMSLFLLSAKLSTKQFNLLVSILSHPEFNKSHLPPSYKAAKKLLRGIPCLPIHLRNLPIKWTSNQHKTKFVPAYTYTVEDILKRQLESPSLRGAMYFGPGRKTSQPREFWDGELWRQSPLFGEGKAYRNDGMYDDL